MPEGPIRANDQGFQVPILVLAYVSGRYNTPGVGRFAQRAPGAPGAIGGGLPEMPEGSIGTNRKDFKAPIGILLRGQGILAVSHGRPARGEPRVPVPLSGC